MSFKDIALPLIERGIRVIPVQPGEKRCLLPSWPQMATTDFLQVEAWDRANPHCNAAAWARRTGIAILDCDVVGLREKIEKETGRRFPRTLVVRSAGKGAEHIYFRQTDRSRALGNRSAMGLYDLQSRDKYCVAPGSKLGNGRAYDIVDDASIADFLLSSPSSCFARLSASTDMPAASRGLRQSRPGNPERNGFAVLNSMGYGWLPPERS